MSSTRPRAPLLGLAVGSGAGFAGEAGAAARCATSSGTSSRMRRADILSRVDELIEEGRLETTGGAYPVLRLPAHAGANAAGI